jgi:hypothetical protein
MCISFFHAVGRGIFIFFRSICFLGDITLTSSVKLENPALLEGNMLANLTFLKIPQYVLQKSL